MKGKKKVRGRNFQSHSRIEADKENPIVTLKMPVPVESKKPEAPSISAKAEILVESIETAKPQVLEVVNDSTKAEVLEESNESTKKVLDLDESSNEEPNESNNMITTALKSVPEVAEVIKHPLENTWGFWLFTNKNKANWAENQKQLTLFDTVEDYWCLYHHMKLPSELRNGQDYAIFKNGISPMWEDPANKAGGRWFINLEQRVSEMDRIWLDVVLFMIGENFVNSDIICGAVVNVRPTRQNKVSVWTRNKDETANMAVGRQLKEMLRMEYRLQFLNHKNSTLFAV